MTDHFMPPARPGDVADSATVRPLRKLAATLDVLFVGWLGLAIALVLAYARERSLLTRAADGERIPMAAAAASDNLVVGLNRAYALLLIVTVVVFVWWFRRAYGNLDALRVTRRFTLGWAIGGWFVPILNWWRPKQVADDLWKSVQAADVRRHDVPRPKSLLAWWWGAFVAAWVTESMISNRVDQTFSELLNTNSLNLVWSTILFVGAILALLVVHAVTTSQAELADDVVADAIVSD